MWSAETHFQINRNLAFIFSRKYTNLHKLDFTNNQPLLHYFTTIYLDKNETQGISRESEEESKFSFEVIWMSLTFKGWCILWNEHYDLV